MNREDPDFDDVQTILDGDLENFENELKALYSDMSRYAEVADVMESMDRGDDAEYFRELAVDAYQSFVYAIQMKKEGGDDYDF